MRIVAALATLLAILGVYYYFKEVHLVRLDEAEKAESRLAAIEPEKVDRVLLKRPDSGEVEISKEAGEWRISRPMQAEADREKVDMIIATASGLKKERVIGEVADLSEFGLDAPIWLEFFHEEKAMGVIKLGARNPSGDGVYAQAGGGEEVFLLSRLEAEDLAISFFDLREKRFYRKSAQDLSAFEFAVKDGLRIRAEKDDGGKWTITHPLKAPASSLAVDSLVNKFLHATASGFYDEDIKDLEEYGLDSPFLEFTAYFNGGETGRRMAIGAAAGTDAYYALWPEGHKAVRVAGDQFKTLPGTVIDLRVRELAVFEAREVTGFSIEKKGAAVQVVKVPSADGGAERWMMEKPSRAEADPVQVSRFLTAAKGLEASGFFEDAEGMEAVRAALESPDMIVTIKPAGEPLVLRFSRTPDGKAYYASSSLRDDLMMAPIGNVAALDKGVFELLERRLLKMSSADVWKVRIERLGEVFEVVKNEDGYMLVLPQKARLSANEYSDFLWTILELRFAGVINEGGKDDDPRFDDPVVVISVFGRDGGLLEKVEIARSGVEKEWYASRAWGMPGIYDIDRFFVEDDLTLALEKVSGILAEEPQGGDGLFRR
ncbi:MAG: DUF4340 domain-containing protein [Nitrospinota bacterium]|nr:DUF4340 domain-containing protein [Nitrospinota bacterium]